MSASKTLPGEIWRVDFGLAAKVRPALMLSDYPADDELALLVVVPHAIRRILSSRASFFIDRPDQFVEPLGQGLDAEIIGYQNPAFVFVPP